MDHFGIGAAMQGVARTYFQCARRSGRTTSLVESVKTGDKIIFANSKEAERVRRLCLERGVTIECIVCEPKAMHRLFERERPNGRTIFDHGWIEQYYLDALVESARELDDMTERLSGDGVAHSETRRCAKEMATWFYRHLTLA